MNDFPKLDPGLDLLAGLLRRINSDCVLKNALERLAPHVFARTGVNTPGTTFPKLANVADLTCRLNSAAHCRSGPDLHKRFVKH
jgi:hypothetical protein